MRSGSDVVWIHYFSVLFEDGGNRGIVAEFRVREDNFLFYKMFRPFPGPTRFPLTGYCRLFSHVQAAEFWSWPLPPSNGEVRNEWSYSSTPSQDPMTCTGTTLFYFKPKCFMSRNSLVFFLNILICSKWKSIKIMRRKTGIKKYRNVLLRQDCSRSPWTPDPTDFCLQQNAETETS